MINANDLRIGNWVQSTDGRNGTILWFNPAAVKLRLEHSTLTVKTKGKFKGLDIEHIPLTPSILEAAGFNKTGDFDNGSVDFYSIDKITVQVNYLDNPTNMWWVVWTQANSLRYQIDIELKYVHQLQNLYYALTGTELQIKLPLKRF